MASSYTYRKIWENHHGKIPKDSNGRVYEIHHINGNHNDNNISNLMLVTIEEHYKIHESQGDWGACIMIGKRMNISSDELSNIQKGKKRPGIGGVPKGTIPWNKGLQGYKLHTEEHKKYISEITRGENSATSKLREMDIKKIREDFDNVVSISCYDNSIKPSKTTKGKYPTYLGAFAFEYSKKYNITPQAIKSIIKRKTWKYVK